MHFHVITLFPGAFDSYLNESIIARAIKNKLINIKFYNPRDFTKDKWARVDRRPYGGGPGMVLEAPAIVGAIESAIKSSNLKSTVFKQKDKILIMSPGGNQFTNVMARKYVKFSDLVIVSGRYEGIDARVKKIFKAEDVTVGPYVLTGGELPAMVLIDSISRQLEGVLGNFDSLEDGRISSSEVYTRPEVFVYRRKKYRVPSVLLKGNHKKIEEWKAKKRLQ